MNVGHGDRSLIEAMAGQASRASYVHGTMFTTDALEDYADDLAPLLPMDDPAIYPVSGGSEAVETALKLARAYHLARGDERRTLVIGRRASYHGNTLGALDVGGKEALRRPYEPWLGRFAHVEPAYEYRCSDRVAPALAAGRPTPRRSSGRSSRPGPGRVAAFIAEPVAGATLAAAVPTDDYWPAVVEVCRRHGVLVIADEVMTGFGRSGRWFGVEHWGVRPDVLVAGKGSTSGYFPFGFAACSGEVFEAVRACGLRPRVHVVAQRGRRGRRARDAPAAARRRPRRRERREGRTPAEGARGGARRRRDRRRRPRARTHGRDRARRRSRDEGTRSRERRR